MTSGSGAFFPRTPWTAFEAANRGGDPETRRALEALCSKYREPVNTYLIHLGHSAEEAEDLAQGFFLDLLQRRFLGRISRDRGRFRSYLLRCLNNFLSKDRRHRQALKRGGRTSTVSLESVSESECMLVGGWGTESPEREFDRRWALVLLEGVLERLRVDYENAGKGSLFEALQPSLIPGGSRSSLKRVAETLGISEGAAKVASHRMRQRYRKILWEEIERTVTDRSMVEEELLYLRRLFSGD